MLITITSPRSAVTAFLMLLSASSGPAPASEQAQVQNRLSADEARAGFQSLFDGHELGHWVHNGRPGSFMVKDGTITGDRTGHNEFAYWLSTDREYGDFELRLQYKLAKDGNSGVFIRAPRQGRASKLGMEIQILDDGQKTGKPTVGSSSSIYQVVAPKAYASKPAGQWNDLWILCDGDRVRVTLNGQVVTDASMADYKQLQSRPRKGYIGLSAHTGPVQFRNIRLREIRHDPTGTRPATTAPAPGR
jgi:hypothetical protein